MEVLVIIQIHSDIVKARESHICRILWECMRFTLFYCNSPYRNSKSNVIFFMKNLLRVLPLIIIEVPGSPVQKNLLSPKLSCMYLAFIQFNNTPLFITSVLEKVFNNRV